MPTVVVSSDTVVNYPDGGGHCWVFLQYIEALRRIGCDVYWMEEFRPGYGPPEDHGAFGPARDPAADQRAVATFLQRTRDFGLEDRVLLYVAQPGGSMREWIGASAGAAEAVIRGADLMLNFHYTIDPSLLAWARRSALMDIDPGLLQLWMHAGQLCVARHDRYFTIGETVGTPRALFPDCGITWIYSPPPVCLELWPPASDPAHEAFTTVSGWWSGRWIKVVENGAEVLVENTKRAAFLPFVDLPRRCRQPLELALDLADSDAPARRLLEGHGWRVRHARDVARTPEMYQAYIRGSRGEWSAAKPSCIRFQNAWLSDRTVCYLASGKPVVVQDTGPSLFLPNGEGMFRFTTVAEAAAGLGPNAHGVAVDNADPTAPTGLIAAARERFEAAGFLVRNDQQFHWENDGYQTFDDFLAALASRKRKQIRKERAEAIAPGIEIEALNGSAITTEAWDAFYTFYMDTGGRKWGRPYLNRAFFHRLGDDPRGVRAARHVDEVALGGVVERHDVTRAEATRAQRSLHGQRRRPEVHGDMRRLRDHSLFTSTRSRTSVPKFARLPSSSSISQRKS